MSTLLLRSLALALAALGFAQIWLPTQTASAEGDLSRTLAAPPSEASSPFLFGTLLSDPRNAPGEYAAGVRLVELELGWDS